MACRMRGFGVALVAARASSARAAGCYGGMRNLARAGASSSWCSSRLFSSSSSPSSSPRPNQLTRPKLTLYTGTDCQLCDEAKHVLDTIARRSGNDGETSAAPPFDLELYNIRDDGMPDVHKWRRAYQYDIPVLHLNGHEIARHRLDESDVIKRLREAQE